MTELERAKEVIQELLDEREALRHAVVRLSGSDNQKKLGLLTKVIKAHPDCYSQIEFDEAFEESTKLIKHD